MTGIEPALAVESAPVYQTGRQATLGLCHIDFIASFDLAVQKRTIPKGNAMTFASVVIVALWCSPAAPIDTFNPHQLGAALAFVQANPADCGEDAPLGLDRDVTLEACQPRRCFTTCRNGRRVILGAFGSGLDASRTSSTLSWGRPIRRPRIDLKGIMLIRFSPMTTTVGDASSRRIQPVVGRGLRLGADPQQRAERIERVKTAVKPERELVEIGLKVLAARRPWWEPRSQPSDC